MFRDRVQRSRGVVLRLVLTAALSVVGWCFLYLYAIGLAATQITTCTMASDDAWMLSFFYLPLLPLGMALVWIGGRWARVFRWLSLPLAPIVASGVLVVSQSSVVATVLGHHLCDAKVWPDSFQASPEWWHPWWGPLEAVAIAGLVRFLIGCWRAAPSRASSPTAST